MGESLTNPNGASSGKPPTGTNLALATTVAARFNDVARSGGFGDFFRQYLAAHTATALVVCFSGSLAGR